MDKTQAHSKQKIEEMVSHMTPEQKLAQLQGMFCGGGSIPPELLHRFPNGLGAIATITCGDGIEKQSEESEKQQKILMENCGGSHPVECDENIIPYSFDGKFFLTYERTSVNVAGSTALVSSGHVFIVSLTAFPSRFLYSLMRQGGLSVR